VGSSAPIISPYPSLRVVLDRMRKFSVRDLQAEAHNTIYLHVVAFGFLLHAYTAFFHSVAALKKYLFRAPID
jgi:hypothetical protein